MWLIGPCTCAGRKTCPCDLTTRPSLDNNTQSPAPALAPSRTPALSPSPTPALAPSPGSLYWLLLLAPSAGSFSWLPDHHLLLLPLLCWQAQVWQVCRVTSSICRQSTQLTATLKVLLTKQYCICIRTRRGISYEIWPKPKEVPEGAAQGNFRELRPCFIVYPDSSPNTDIIPFLWMIMLRQLLPNNVSKRLELLNQNRIVKHFEIFVWLCWTCHLVMFSVNWLTSWPKPPLDGVFNKVKQNFQSV